MLFGNEQLPYNPISQFYKSTFGEKVFKVPVALADDCPNRRGLKGMETCIFCDEYGSFAYPQNQKETLRKQIVEHREKVAERFNSKKFLVYFQAYTTTFNQLQKIKDAFEIALSFDEMVGIVVGTRPDCLSPALLNLWHETSQKTFLSVEIGAQSFDDKQLEWMKRGHTAEQTIKGVERIRQHCPDVTLGLHLMFGWPGETVADVIHAAKMCNELKVNNVKLHNLHVLKNTPLEKMFFAEEFTPIEFEPYCELVAAFLAHLSPDIYVHRLIALASRWDELIAPEWTRYKMTNYQKVIEYLRDKNITQGQHEIRHLSH
ncbi:MAG: TIGR01212 family radical SAM protein [Bdellovibrionales bacterium]|nr:TIGR01212 family radical SAM protein [Bdellovibrionales bacterium]